jgi:hypothetical protein
MSISNHGRDFCGPGNFGAARECTNVRRWSSLNNLRFLASILPDIDTAQSRANQGFSRGDLRVDQSNDQNYESACPWDIYKPDAADEMVDSGQEWPSTI